MNGLEIEEILRTGHNEDIFYEAEFDQFGDDETAACASAQMELRINEVQDAMYEGAKLIKLLRDIIHDEPVDIELIRELLS